MGQRTQAPTRIDPVATAAQADDPLAIPAFLKRESTPEEKEAVRKKLARTVGPGRVIKDPPDVKTKRAEQREARQAEFEETPASARRKARERAGKKTQDNGARTKKRASGAPTKGAGAPEGQSKREMIGAMLLRPNGCTNAEVRAACNWPAVYLKEHADACGLILRKVKTKGQPTRYFGSR